MRCRSSLAGPEAAFGGAAVTTEEPLEVGCGPAAWACVSVRVRVDKASDKCSRPAGITVNSRLCYTSAVPLPESCTAVYPVIDIYGKTSEITLLQD
eukprot:m51a1_g8899 hypothetical protein (96) ;mRNA; f:717287-719341